MVSLWWGWDLNPGSQALVTLAVRAGVDPLLRVQMRTLLSRHHALSCAKQFTCMVLGSKNAVFEPYLVSTRRGFPLVSSGPALAHRWLGWDRPVHLIWGSINRPTWWVDSEHHLPFYLFILFLKNVHNTSRKVGLCLLSMHFETSALTQYLQSRAIFLKNILHSGWDRLESGLHGTGAWSWGPAVGPDISPVIAELCRVQEVPEENIRNTGVVKGPPAGSGKQVFYHTCWKYCSVSRTGWHAG